MLLLSGTRGAIIGLGAGLIVFAAGYTLWGQATGILGPRAMMACAPTDVPMTSRNAIWRKDWFVTTTAARGVAPSKLTNLRSIS